LPVVTAIAGAAAGVIGGTAIGRRLRSQRKVLGVSVPEVGSGMETLGRQLGEAARQFAKLAGEVRAARERAEKIGKALS
jgi:hypothetical protein